MKKALSAILLITLAQVTKAQVIGGGLTGTGTRILQVNSSGEIIPLTPGTSSQVLFGNGTWGDLLLSTSGGNTLFPTGSVGIGNTSPTKTLDVTGTFGVSGDATFGANLILPNITGKGLSIGGGQSGIFYVADGERMTLPTSLTGNFIFTAANTNLLGTLNVGSLATGDTHLTEVYVDGDGNLKLGNTGPGANLLFCANGSLNWQLGGNNVLPFTSNNQIPSAGTCDNYDFILKANNTRYMWIKTDGKIGIANSSPAAMLDVNTSGTVAGFNVSNGSSNLFSVASDGSTLINSSSTSNSSFAITNTTGTPFEVKADGHVIINDDNTVPIGPSLAHFQINVSDQLIPFLVTSKNATGNTINLFGVGPDGTTQIVDNDPSSTNPVLIMTHSSGSTLKFMQNGPGDIYSSGPIRPTFEYAGDFTVLEGHSGSEQLRFQVLPGGGTVIQTNHPTTGTADALSIQNNMAPSGSGNALYGSAVFTVKDDGNVLMTSGAQLTLKDANHGLGYYNNNFITTGNHTLIDGPVLYGYSGGALGTNQGGVHNVALAWDNSGVVYIGARRPDMTKYPTTKLSVDGSVTSTEFWVVDNATGGWADYVFKNDYKLMSLKDLEKYINSNKHLPNIPSAKEVENTGQNLGRLQVLQMEKIEELTLYLIEMKKQNDDLKKEVESLRQAQDEIKKKLK